MGPTSQKLRRSVPYMGRTRPEGAPTRNQFFKITSHLRNGHQARRGVSSCKAECNALSNTHFKQHGEGRGGRVRACSPSGAGPCARMRALRQAHACSPAGAGPPARMRALRRAQGRVRACMLFGGSRENCVQNHPREGRSNRGSGERARSTSVSRAQRRAQGQTGQGGGDWASSTDVARSREGPPQTHRTAAQHLKRTLPANGKHGYWDQ